MDKVKNAYRSALHQVDRNTLSDRPLTYGGDTEYAVQDKRPSFSPDGKLIAYVSNRSGKPQVLVMPTNGGEPIQVTDMPNGVKSYAWSPDSAWIVVAARTDGTRASDGLPKDETDQSETETQDVRVIRNLRFHGNGEGFYDGKSIHLSLVEVATRKVRQLTTGRYNETHPCFSPDGKRVAFISWRDDDERDVTPSIYAINVNTEEMNTVYQGRGGVSALSYSPNGEWIAFFGHDKGEVSGTNSYVWVVPAKGGEARCLTGSMDRPQGTQVGTDARYETGESRPIWSTDGTRIYFTATRNGDCSVYSVTLDGDVREETRTAACVVTSFDVATDGELVVAQESPTCPAEIFLYADGEGRQVTDHNRVLKHAYAVAEPEPFSVTSHDGWTIPGWVLRPADFDSNKKYPLVLEIHGGPHSSYGNTFQHEFQLLAAHGYVVLYMNPRGSHGYGERFVQGCIGDWGGNDYQDLMAAVDEVIKLPYIDSDLLFVTGGSYGGYMTNWIVGHTDRFRAAVTQRCISNIYSMYGTSDIGFWFNKAELGGADLWDNEELIMERSPIRYANNVKTPTKIIHSEEDYRCPMEQGQQWFTALKRFSVDTEFVRFAGENHDLSRNGKPHNRIARLKHIVEWFEHYR
ncbi:S9 family peptidase [Alicyclobacillus dauci]|uniref:Acyl-peptide hydrolase n=1 Tax=Alicyclobacillus dauci TaxID=1475485 RepID=A0ABY6Z1S4_9BACL|nr:S9 family peptidase [Alicyclobacillus dauci]WAH36637.1 S9 family peptidase [Alicyclobacillus dauci]